MKKLILFAMLPFMAFAKTCVYDVTMHLRVPAIVDNMQSLGRRVYKTQLLKGRMTVTDGKFEPTVAFTALENRSHKVSRQYVSYDVVVDNVGWHAVGNNRTGVFRKASVFLSFEATPSYALAGGEDNTRIYGTDNVVDTAAVYGTWRARKVKEY